ncbi:MAG: 2-amino-4-hydroxy-6-hydroxymethyldihydropteridine diphosphokinase, partial [Chitinophagales bacterium]
MERSSIPIVVNFSSSLNAGNPSRAFVTGGNLGDRYHHLAAAKKQIAKHVGLIEKESSIYETEPWGVTDQPS